MTTHHCHAVGCDVPVKPELHMCAKHWRMVPRFVQNLLWHHYRRGQEIDKQPSVEYIATAFVSISCVAMQEGRALPRFLRSANAEETQATETIEESASTSEK